MKRSRIAVMPAMALTLLLGAGAAAAQASSIALTVSVDPAEEQAFTVTTSGTADVSSDLRVAIRAAGGAACAATASTETGQSLVNSTVAAGPYSLPRTYTPESPGAYLVCAYIGTSATAPPAAAATTTVTVRANRATLALVSPASSIPAQPVVFTFQGATEVRRELYATIKPAGATACGTARATDAGGQTVVNGDSIQGAYAISKTQTPAAGVYLICAWVQESSGDLAPDAVASAQIVVKLPDADNDGVPDASDRCPSRPAPGSKKGCPPRVAPAAFSAAVKRRRDRSAPYTFGFSGRLVPPAGITVAEACNGKVSVKIMRGAKVISTRQRTLRSNCTWASTIAFSNRSRIGRSGRLKAAVRFLGNDLLSPRSAKALSIRAG
jgi:hypothetical protein